jgi:biopolymer transport protein ExbD
VLDRNDLDARLQVAAQQPEQPEIHVHAEAKTPYDTVAAVLTAAQKHGLLKIGVVGLEEYTTPAPITPASAP